MRLDEALTGLTGGGDDLPLAPVAQPSTTAPQPAAPTPALPPRPDRGNPAGPPTGDAPLPTANRVTQPAEPDVGHVADRVYSLLVDRLSSERRLRGL
jgi:hypothetical protein